MGVVALAILDRLSLWINRVMSWSAWVPVLLVGSFTGVWLHQTDLVMLILTVQTSLDAAATKTLQSHVRALDDKKNDFIRQQLIDSSDLIVEVRRQNDLLLDLMHRAERRDALAAKRDKTTLQAIEASTEILELMGKEVGRNEQARKTAATARRKRAQNGRSARKKS